MLLLAEPKPPGGSRRRERPFWRTVLFVTAVATTISATLPWTRVEFVRLFGEVFGPPAWQDSSAGFTCLCTSALVFVMALAETQTRTARQAVRPASLLLAAIMTLALMLHLVRGPGTLRGVGAMWTISLYIGALASLALFAACAVRFAAMQPPGRRRRPSA